MLPFFKNQKRSDDGVSMPEIRKPDGGFALDDDKSNDNEGLEACAMDIIRAISENNPKALAAALQAAQVCMESPQENQE